MTWRDDKWIWASVFFAAMAAFAMYSAKPNHVGIAVFASWFCGANFVAWLSYHVPPKSAQSGISNYPAYPSRLGKDGVTHVDQYDVHRWEVEMRRVAAKPLPSAGFGHCQCCHMPWWVVSGHVVDYDEFGGCFPVCEMCWRDLNRDELWPYYEAWIRESYPADAAKEKTLKRNVLAGSYFSEMPAKGHFEELN